MSAIRLKEGIIIKTGMRVRLNAFAESEGIAPEGTTPVVYKIQRGHNGEHDVDQIALYNKDYKIDGWHDLDGQVDSRRGKWFNATELGQYIDLPDEKMVIDKNMNFKGRNLKGMKCQFLIEVDPGTVFVELEEDIGGCSADGFGKAGRCIAVNKKMLKSCKKKSKLEQKEN